MAAVANPFEYTATGVLGDKRDTMLENQLLLRSKLGRPMQRGYTSYPGESWRYGRPNIDLTGGAQEALHWSGGPAGLHFPGGSNHGNTSKSMSGGDRDFMALNRAAVHAGMVSSDQQYQFRATHDIRKKVSSSSDDVGQTSGKSGNRSRRLPPSMVFGISTRPSTPIHDLLEHKYQDRWLAERRSADMAQNHHGSIATRSAPPSSRLMPSKVTETKASLLRVHQVPVEPAPLWKLPKFSKHARASLSTFRTEPAKQGAMRHASSDGISRQGTFNHGIYEPAKA